MLKLLRKAWARYQMTHAQWDIAYWTSAEKIARENRERAERVLVLMQHRLIEIDYPLPNVVRRTP